MFVTFMCLYVKARSRQSQCKGKARLGKGQGKVMARSWQCQSQFKTRLGQVHGKVKERIRQGKSKVKARSRGKFNNSNSFSEYRINVYQPQLTPMNGYNNKNHNNKINNNYNKTNLT